MPTVAAYWVVSDGSVEFGPASTGNGLPGVSDHHFEQFGPLNVAPAFPLCILAFKVNPTLVDASAGVTLRVRLNNTVLLEQKFDTIPAPQRSWHEVFSADALVAASNNELVMSTPSDTHPQAKIAIADVVLFYRITIP